MRKIYHSYQPQPRWFRAIIRNLIHLVLNILTDITVEGRENIPKKGGFLVVANHFSFTDPVVVVHALPHNIEYIAGAAPIHAPNWTKLLPSLWGVIPVTRGGSSKDALRIAEQELESGGVVGIFPEAGSWAQVLRPARPGTSYLASRTNAPILPIGIEGTFDIFPALKKFKRAKVRIKIGKLFGPYKVTTRGRERREALDKISVEIMKKIAELIPAKRHGHFSDDPAIREAAKGTEIYPWDELGEGQVEAFGEKI